MLGVKLAIQTFFNSCIGRANFSYFLHWQCIFFKFLHWECKFLLFFALAMQIFLILALAMHIFFIFCIGNAIYFNFLHRQFKLFLFLALGMQIFFILCIGNATFFLLFNFEIVLLFQSFKPISYPILTPSCCRCRLTWIASQISKNDIFLDIRLAVVQTW